MRAISAASPIICSSRVVRPAVSRITTSKPPRRAAESARRAMSDADCPGTMDRVSTSICLPRVASCSIAAGRRVSSEAIRTFLRSVLTSRAASLAEVVVLPEPCRPAIRITAGGATLRFRPSGSSPPSMSTRPSWTILTTCSDGLTARITVSPAASSRALAMKSLTTGRATSASSRARRTSRRASSTSLSDRTPRPVSRSKTLESRSPRESNMTGVSNSISPTPIDPRGRSRQRGASPPSSLRQGILRQGVVAEEGAIRLRRSGGGYAQKAQLSRTNPGRSRSNGAGPARRGRWGRCARRAC